MKRLHYLLTSLLVIVLLAGCSKKDQSIANLYVVTGTATAVSNAGNSNAYATILGGYNAGSKKLAFNITWHNVGSQATGASLRITQGNGLLKSFGVTEGNTSGLAAGDMVLTPEQASQLMGGQIFYTVNTLEHPDGEIVGKLLVAPEE